MIAERAQKFSIIQSLIDVPPDRVHFRQPVERHAVQSCNQFALVCSVSRQS